MANFLEYALMAGVSYRSSRSLINRFPIPSGWSEVPGSYERNPDSGFEAVSFTNGHEIVISYAGTDFGLNPDLLTDASLILGIWDTQLGEAVEYYLNIKAANPDALISLTGHSMGGALAALVSVFCGEVQTVSFDQAPFAASASAMMRHQLVTYLTQRGYTPAQLSQLAPALMEADFIPGIGALNVTNYFVQGEIASIASNLRIGYQTSIERGPANWIGSSVDLHAQSLLAAFVQSMVTADPGQALHQVTEELPDVLEMIFDERLFANSVAANTPNLLEHLVRHQTGGMGDVAAGGDGMVTRFTADTLLDEAANAACYGKLFQRRAA